MRSPRSRGACSSVTVIDPGHGGCQMAGASTPGGAQGVASEKALALDVALRVRAHAPESILLTRDRDRNLSLGARIAFGRAAKAEQFLSIHAGGASRDYDTWIHARAAPASRAFGARVAGELARALGTPQSPLRAGTLAVLDPDFHAPEVAACLVELGSFGSVTNASELSDPVYRQSIADALASAVRSHEGHWQSSVSVSGATPQGAFHSEWSRFDIWHEVPLVQQLTGMSCWAAAAAMIVGWRDCIDIDADDVARGAGRWHSYRDGLEPRDVEQFAREWGLEVARPRSLSVTEIRGLLEQYGPLWVGEASPGLHVVVVAGLHGDGTPDGTFVRIADPWPIGRGERYTVSFREFEENLRAASAIARVPPQILHAAAGARGTALFPGEAPQSHLDPRFPTT